MQMLTHFYFNWQSNWQLTTTASFASEPNESWVWSPISRAHIRTPAYAASLQVPWIGASYLRVVSVIAAVHVLLIREMARLSRPRASMCKFLVHKNCAVTRVSITGFEPMTSWSGIQYATTRPTRHLDRNSTWKLEMTEVNFCQMAQLLCSKI